MTRQRIRRRSAGFTLVEILVVIAIIGILTSLITAAAMMARNSALNAVMRTEINQLDMALADYKNQYGDYPPDFFGVWLPSNTNGNSIGDQARAEVARHLRKAFPSYRPGSVSGSTATSAFDRFIADLTAMDYLPKINNYADLEHYLNPGTALPFWLGGMPADDGSGSSTKLMGFSANPKNPFGPSQKNSSFADTHAYNVSVSASRKKPLFEFNDTRLFCVCDTDSQDDHPFYYYVPERPTTDAAPYVYFKPRRNATSGKIEYAVGDTTLIPLYFQVSTVVENPAGGDQNVAVPYLQNAWEAASRNSFVESPTNATEAVRVWQNPKSVQILCAGFDGIFGHEENPDTPQFRFTPTEDQDALVVGDFGDTAKDNNNPDYDNLTNFLPGTIEDQMP